MKDLDKIAFLAAVLALCGCAELSSWVNGQSLTEEEKLALKEVAWPAHPVGATYDVTKSGMPARQITVFYDGKGLARILDASVGKEKKTIIDFKKQQITNKDFKANSEETLAIDPLEFPSVLNARDALSAHAACTGKGVTRGFPYHRWRLNQNGSEWEVWTDDKDSFPVYYRSIKSGDVVTWTIVSSWIDGSTYDKPTFFSLLKDPPPPEPVKTEEELAQKKIKRELELQKRHHVRPKRRDGTKAGSIEQ
jgi:hypothetical protein